MRSARSAAHGVLLAAAHFEQFSVEFGDDLARCQVLSVRTPEVARIVEGDAPTFERGVAAHAQFARFDELADELRVVEDLIGAAQFRVFVLEGIEAVGAPGDDALDAVSVKRGDVLSRLHLVQELIARAFGRITGAGLFLAEHRKRRFGGVKDARDGFGNAFGAVVKTARTTYPEKHIGGLT